MYYQINPLINQVLCKIVQLIYWVQLAISNKLNKSIYCMFINSAKLDNKIAITYNNHLGLVVISFSTWPITFLESLI